MFYIFTIIKICKGEKTQKYSQKLYGNKHWSIFQLKVQLG